MSPVLNNLLPVFALMALGRLLLRLGLLDREFFRLSDRLVYFVLFPALLFWKLGVARAGGKSGGQLELAALQAVPWILAAVGLVWLAGLAYMHRAGYPPAWRGSFSQLTFRFNTYVGMAVVLTTLGEAGVTVFGVIMGLLIPFINLLCVGTLIWYGGEQAGGRRRLLTLARALVGNPLILGCAAGLAYGRWGVPLPPFVHNTLALMSSLTLPLALLSIGAGLGLDKLKGQLGPALVAAGFKLLLLPALGLGMLWLAGVRGIALQVSAIYLTLPTAASTHILSRQLGGEVDLALAGTVLSTLLSFLSLSAVLLVWG